VKLRRSFARRLLLPAFLTGEGDYRGSPHWPAPSGRRANLAGSGAISRAQAIRDSYDVLSAVAPHLTVPARKIVIALVLGESGFGTIIMKNGFTEDDGSPTHN
jgi:hypothetical protein